MDLGRTRETALGTIREMVTNLGSAQFLVRPSFSPRQSGGPGLISGDSVQDYIEIVMGRLLECVKDDSRMVAQKTEEALEALIHAISPPQRCLQVLIPIIISEQAPVLQASIRTLSKLVPRIPTEALLESLPSMLPGLFEVRITLTARAFCVALLCSQQAFGRRSTTRTRTCGRPWCSAWWTSTWCSARSSKRTWASSMPRRYAGPQSFPAFPRLLRAFTVAPTRFQRALAGPQAGTQAKKTAEAGGGSVACCCWLSTH